MALILNIDTSVDQASVCISENKEQRALAIYEGRESSWLHVTIKSLIDEFTDGIHHLDAIAVTIGPGSYTGLRSGLATAKGLCFAADLPLIAVGTLPVIALSGKIEKPGADIICPLIDARRNEVFTALYDRDLNVVDRPHSKLLDDDSFIDLLNSKRVLFCGNGNRKLNVAVNNHVNSLFANQKTNAFYLSQLAYDQFITNKFADVAYTEPLYIKDFFSSPPPKDDVK